MHELALFTPQAHHFLVDHLLPFGQRQLQQGDDSVLLTNGDLQSLLLVRHRAGECWKTCTNLFPTNKSVDVMSKALISRQKQTDYWAAKDADTL